MIAVDNCSDNREGSRRNLRRRRRRKGIHRAREEIVDSAEIELVAVVAAESARSVVPYSVRAAGRLDARNWYTAKREGRRRENSVAKNCDSIDLIESGRCRLGSGDVEEGRDRKSCRCGNIAVRDVANWTEIGDAIEYRMDRRCSSSVADAEGNPTAVAVESEYFAGEAVVGVIDVDLAVPPRLSAATTAPR